MKEQIKCYCGHTITCDCSREVETALDWFNNELDDKEQLNLCSVDIHLFGVYSPDDNLLSVHISEEGAEENKNAFEKNYKIEGYYVDYVMLHP